MGHQKCQRSSGEARNRSDGYANTALEIQKDRTLMLRFELKHLGQYNYRTDSLNHYLGDTNQGTIPR